MPGGAKRRRICGRWQSCIPLCRKFLQLWIASRNCSQMLMHTVTAHDREAIVCAHIDKYFNGEYKGCGDRAGDPLSTVTALPRHGLCSAHVVKFKGQELGQHPEDTLNTITAQGLEYAECRAVLAKVESGRDLGNWPKTRDLLNKYCGYELKEDEVILRREGPNETETQPRT